MVCKNPSFLCDGGVGEAKCSRPEQSSAVTQKSECCRATLAFPLKTMQFWNALLEGLTPCTVRQSLRGALLKAVVLKPMLYNSLHPLQCRSGLTFDHHGS